MFNKIFALVLCGALSVLKIAAAPVTIQPGQLWPDEKGEHINAHCGDIVKVGDTYYWFGEYRDARPIQKISCYVSTDLQHWKFDRLVLTPDSSPEVAKSHLERPKVIFNEKTKKYVMWLHREATRGYADAQCAVASCDTIDGDYVWQDAFRPNGNISRDCTLFKDDDGKAYFISSSNENADMILYRLTDDYRRVDAQIAVLTPRMYREAPCLFKRNGIYYLITSFCTGAFPNTQCYSTSRSIEGPWAPLQKLCGSETWNTFYSQGAFVLNVHGTRADSFIYCGDRWLIRPMRHVWLPLRFSDDGSILPMRWADEWTLDAATGEVSFPDPPSPVEANLAKGAVATSDYVKAGPPLTGDRSYSHPADHEPSAANDGDARTAWIANDNLPGHWWEVDLGAPHDLSGSEISWHRNTDRFRYRIEASPDDRSWTVVADHSDAHPSPTTARAANLPNPTSADRFNAKAMRYARVMITGIPAGYDWPGFAECKIFSGESDVAAGKPSHADSFQPNTSPAAAIDGDVATAWTIDDMSVNHWLKIDLGKPTRIGGCRIRWEGPGYFYQYKIETSADDKNWSLADDETQNKRVDSFQTHLFAATDVRYVRLAITGVEQGCWPGVREIEIVP